jgi:hypothetical protein
MDSMYISSNYGATWTQTATTQVWQAVAMSASGQYQTAVVNSSTVGFIYISSNYGVTWTHQTATSQGWTAVAMSASGQYQTAAVCSGTGIPVHFQQLRCDMDTNRHISKLVRSSDVGVRPISNGGGYSLDSCIFPPITV